MRSIWVCLGMVLLVAELALGQARPEATSLSGRPLFSAPVTGASGTRFRKTSLRRRRLSSGTRTMRQAAALPIVRGVAAGAGQRAARRPGDVVEALGPRVGTEKLQAVAQTFGQAQLQRVIP